MEWNEKGLLATGMAGRGGVGRGEYRARRGERSRGDRSRDATQPEELPPTLTVIFHLQYTGGVGGILQAVSCGKKGGRERGRE